MSTKTWVWISWATLALTLITLIPGAVWWAWAIWALLATLVITLHALAWRADLM
ncbi:hypothetical protein [Nocardiopsis tropica]|uniref:Uncharacterized protein n=1 Tax=Nocardiopsis tropica TaxID=109330 RepID=A0ABU7KUG4_9ACTN|nr:hypothetical protein [Nocardiopsis umidischolae]MEE2052940.1 hypothetical protein [Nocardiopsis umidischolae]